VILDIELAKNAFRELCDCPVADSYGVEAGTSRNRNARNIIRSKIAGDRKPFQIDNHRSLYRPYYVDRRINASSSITQIPCQGISAWTRDGKR
jgi:hypothetical protein